MLRRKQINSLWEARQRPCISYSEHGNRILQTWWFLRKTSNIWKRNTIWVEDGLCGEKPLRPRSIRDKQQLLQLLTTIDTSYRRSSIRKAKLYLICLISSFFIFKRLAKHRNTLNQRKVQFDSYENHRNDLEKKQAFKAWRQALSKRRKDKAKVASLPSSHSQVYLIVIFINC